MIHTIPQLQAAHQNLTVLLAEIRIEESTMEARAQELTLTGVTYLIALASIEDILLDMGVIPEGSTQK